VNDALLDVVRRGLRTFDLGRPMFMGMPQSPNHPAYWHTLPRRHGDVVRADGGSAANDLVVTGTHVGTHIDALAHVSQDGRLHGGADAVEAGAGGRFLAHGVHTIDPIVRRGVLLDVAGALGVRSCDPGYEITPDDLRMTEKWAGVTVEAGDVVLVRSGWGRLFDSDPEAYLGRATGVPGVAEAGALWLAQRRVHAAGADTIAFERLPPQTGHSLLPAHRILLVDSGIYIIETLALDELAQAQAYEFTLVVIPLNLIGATGSPVRPQALVARG
jgi:kynurenine formamidase